MQYKYIVAFNGEIKNILKIVTYLSVDTQHFCIAGHFRFRFWVKDIQLTKSTNTSKNLNIFEICNTSSGKN